MYLTLNAELDSVSWITIWAAFPEEGGGVFSDIDLCPTL